jgi:predicted TIM-barrel fold metal-dependent hydrolase
VIIDVHGHISPPESLRKYPMPASLGDVAGMIETKLQAGIGLTVLGSPVGGGAMVPLPGVDNYAQTTDDLRRFHEWLGSLVRDHPEHLRAYVYANPFGDDDHLDLVRELAAEPEFVGLIANSSVAGRYLHDPAADGFFALAAELDLPVLLHAPAAPAAGHGLTDLMLVEQLGRFCDVTIGAACCILGGWLDRYPRLRLIATTGGGALALLAEKLDLAWASPHWGGRPGGPSAALPRLASPPTTYLRRIWVDTATPSEAALAADLAVFGADRLLLGTDSPPLPADSPARTLAGVGAIAADQQVREAIQSGNARELFGSRLTTELVPGAVPAGPHRRMP